MGRLSDQTGGGIADTRDLLSAAFNSAFADTSYIHELPTPAPAPVAEAAQTEMEQADAEPAQLESAAQPTFDKKSVVTIVDVQCVSGKRGLMWQRLFLGMPRIFPDHTFRVDNASGQTASTSGDVVPAPQLWHFPPPALDARQAGAPGAQPAVGGGRPGTASI